MSEENSDDKKSSGNPGGMAGILGGLAAVITALGTTWHTISASFHPQTTPQSSAKLASPQPSAKLVDQRITPGGNVPNPAHTYGAIATPVSGKNDYYYIHSLPSQLEAEKQAVVECQKKFNATCILKTGFNQIDQDKCIAIAKNPTNLAWGFGANRIEAEKKAMLALKSLGKIDHWGCR